MSEISPDAAPPLASIIDPKNKRSIDQTSDIDLRRFTNTGTLAKDRNAVFTKYKKPKTGSSNTLVVPAATNSKQARHSVDTTILTVRARDTTKSNSTSQKKARHSDGTKSLTVRARDSTKSNSTNPKKDIYSLSDTPISIQYSKRGEKRKSSTSKTTTSKSSTEESRQSRKHIKRTILKTLYEPVREVYTTTIGSETLDFTLLTETQHNLDFLCDPYQKILIDSLRYYWERAFIRLSKIKIETLKSYNTKRNKKDKESIKEVKRIIRLIKGGICGKKEISVIDKALACAIFLGKHEINHDFLSSKIPNDKLKRMRELFDILTKANKDAFSAQYNRGESKSEYELLESLYNENDPEEWDAFSKTMLYILKECPEEVAKWVVYKYDEIDNLDNFIRDHPDIDPNFIIGIRKTENGSETTKYYLVIDQYFKPVIPSYNKSILFGPVDATFKTSLLSPCISGIEPIQTIEGVKIYDASIIDGWNLRLETPASILDPSSTPKITAADANVAVMFTYPDTDKGWWYAFIQSCFNPNNRYSIIFMNEFYKLFTKCVCSMFGSTTSIVFQMDEKTEFDKFNKLVDTLKSNAPKNYDELKSKISGFYNKEQQQFYSGQPLLFTTDTTQTYNGPGILIQEFYTKAEGKPSNEPFRFCRLILTVEETQYPLFLGFDDFAITKIEYTVNLLLAKNNLTIETVIAYCNELSGRDESKNAAARLIYLAYIIYIGIPDGNRPIIALNKILALIVLTFKARGDSNQVSFLALIKEMLDKSTIDPDFYRVIMEIIRLLTNDKNTIVSGLLSNLNMIRGGGGYRVHIEQSALTNTDLRFYFGNLVASLESHKEPVYAIDTYKNVKPNTTKSITVTIPVEGGEFITVRQIFGIFNSFLTYYDELLTSFSLTFLRPEIQALFSEDENEPNNIKNVSILLEDIIESLLDISKLSGIIVNQITFEANKEQFKNVIQTSLQFMSNQSASTIQVFFFTQNYSSNLIGLLSDEISDFYKELFSAYNMFQLLNGETVKALITQEKILKDEFEFLKKLTDKKNRDFESNAISNSRINTLRTLLVDYIYGKKIEIIEEGLKKANDVFHIPPYALDNIAELNRNANSGKSAIAGIANSTFFYITEREKLKLSKLKRTTNQGSYKLENTEKKDIKRGELIRKIDVLKKSVKKLEKEIIILNLDTTKTPKIIKQLEKLKSQIITKNTQIEKLNAELNGLDIIKKLPVNADLVADFLRPYQPQPPLLREGGSKKRKTRKLYRNKK